MAIEWVSKFSQSTLLGPGGGPSAEGVCYYMCHYLECHDWTTPGVFEAAKSKAKQVNRTAMVNYAKAANIKYNQRGNPAPAPPVSLTFQRLYRLSVGVNAAGSNHAIAVLTGAGHHETLVFDPNMGFYIPTGGATNRASIETECAALYAPDTISFNKYHPVRGLSLATPSGWPVLHKKTGAEC